MTTTDPQNRIEQLKSRWEADPSSRVFVQLAEEYRRQGRTPEAISVLQEGLSTQPNYVTAQVALGRCQLEDGHAPEAVEVLSRVMEQDPSHPLAGKLLVEAHLETGELEEARRRLDLYRMMADGDPDIEKLEERLRDAGPSGPDRGDSDPEEAEAGSSDVFDLGSIELSLPETTSGLQSSAVEPPADEPAAPPARPKLGPPSGAQDEPFGDLLDGAEMSGSEDSAGEIFQLTDVSEPSPAAVPPTFSPPAPAPMAPARAETEDAEPPEEPPPPDDMSPRPATEQEAQDEERDEATVTLGQLYMSQGHDEEAARIFRSILERDPGNDISRKALAELEARMSGAVLDELSEQREPPEPPSRTPVAQEAAAEPDVTESAGTESAGTESAGTELAGTESAGTESAGSATTGIETTGTERSVTEPAVEEPQAGTNDTVGITARKISKLEEYLERLRRAAG